MSTTRRWRHAVALFLASALFFASGCTDNQMTLAYYFFSTVSTVLQSSLTSTSTTDTSTSTATTS